MAGLAADGESPGHGHRAARPELSIIVCVLNEEAAIRDFVAAVDAVLPRLNLDGHEIVFVDDGSTDATWAEIAKLREARSDIVAVRLVRNAGKENALTAGLAAASGRAHVPMDVDLQDPPELLEELLQAWRQGYDVVLARRQARHDSWFRRLGGWFIYTLLEKGSGIYIPRDVGDFRLLSADTTERFLRLPERSRYNKGLFSLVSTENVSVVDYVRPASRTGPDEAPRQNLRKLIRLSVNGIVSFTTWPLKILSAFGFLVLSLSILVASLGIVLRIFGVLEVPGQTTVVVLFSFLLGFQALSTGILGLYVGQILEEVKGRPLFAVAETLGLERSSLAHLEEVSAGSAARTR